MDTQQSPVSFQSTPTPEHKKIGPIIAVLVIILVLVIGALYIFASSVNKQSVPVDNTIATDTSDPAQADNTTPAPEVKPITNQADDVSSLEADLNASTKGLDGQNF